MNDRELLIDENTLIAFEIGGKLFKLSDYDTALEENKENLMEYYPFLVEFPYTVRGLKGNAVEAIKNAPVYIVCKGEKTSIYDYIKENRAFEALLPQVDEINGLECIHELDVVFKHLEKRDQYHAVIIETFRILQDLSFSLNTARYALMQAHRKLHFTSELKWSTGWEQLWSRATWLNNAIVIYNSCFDKLIQSVWIGFGSFVGYQKKDKNNKPIGQPLDYNYLFSREGIDKIYQFCDYNTINGLLPQNVNSIVSSKYANELKTIRVYANRIKHRGGMRYIGLFPYGNICEMTSDDCYSATRTQIEDDIDEVIKNVKSYHIVFCELIKNVFAFIMEEFRNHGYLTVKQN